MMSFLMSPDLSSGHAILLNPYHHRSNDIIQTIRNFKNNEKSNLSFNDKIIIENVPSKHIHQHCPFVEFSKWV
jgi:hypothetical protein